MATSFNERVNFCCLLHSEEILYKPGGGMMLHYKRDETTIRECPAAMKLQRGCSECYKGIGWQEPDCNSCKPGWQAPDCEACRIGWHGNNCHVCKFGFDPRTGCTTCIQNGLWQGTVEISQDIWGYSVRLSFEGHDCSTLVPGTTFLFLRVVKCSLLSSTFKVIFGFFLKECTVNFPECN